MDETNNNTNAARSRHPGGVQVLMADGSVQFISNSIDSHPFGDALYPGIWQRLATIDGGEVIPPVVLTHQLIVPDSARKTVFLGVTVQISPYKQNITADNTMQKILVHSVSCLFLAAIVGCGTSNRAAVEGRITLDGRPIEGDTISFIPTDSKAGPPAWGEIKAGCYSIPAKTGPAVGTNRVEINLVRKTVKILPNGLEEMAVALPTRYNSQSELKAEIKPGKNQLDFELKSK